eukprot:2583527-Amphidinium_carterae.1
MSLRREALTFLLLWLEMPPSAPRWTCRCSGGVDLPPPVCGLSAMCCANWRGKCTRKWLTVSGTKTKMHSCYCSPYFVLPPSLSGQSGLVGKG